MRRLLLIIITALAGAAWVSSASAAVTVLPDDACPSGEAVATHLQRLGALALVSELGTAEVHIEEPSLRLHFRDRRGDALGDRVVTAPADCDARAALAAAVIAAFAGEWTRTAIPPAGAAATAKAAPPSLPWRSELAVAGGALHDGDTGGFGLGVRVDLGRGAWLAGVQVEASSERERALGPGQGGYRFVRAGLGLGVRQAWSRLFWDVTLVPMVDRLSLVGKNHLANLTVTTWGFALAGQTRLGWAFGRVRPFLFMAASYRIPRERMTLLDRPDNVLLSAVNLEAGLGICLGISP
jgi:hypothetical protein